MEIPDFRDYIFNMGIVCSLGKAGYRLHVLYPVMNRLDMVIYA